MDEAALSGGSPFPAQCTFDIVEEFGPVPEAEFRHVLGEQPPAKPRRRLAPSTPPLGSRPSSARPSSARPFRPDRLMGAIREPIGPIPAPPLPPRPGPSLLVPPTSSVLLPRRPVDAEYTERQRFKFKLSRWQCHDLIEALCRYDAKQRARRLSEELSLT